MKILRCIEVLCVAGFLALSAFFVGLWVEAVNVQATCEADNGDTVILGQHYLCLSQRQIDILREQRKQRGLHGSPSA